MAGKKWSDERRKRFEAQRMLIKNFNACLDAALFESLTDEQKVVAASGMNYKEIIAAQAKCLIKTR